jgi:CRISPR/Cas system-associated exonuclease Cas4 (RecB family)
MATKRTGRPYIWTTWLAKQLGGDMCRYSAWFKAHFRYDKYEEMALDLSQWNKEHNALMLLRQRQLEADGWVVEVESQNDFKLEGRKAVVAGKPDLVARKGDAVRIIDGKTGRERDSDIFQVLVYLYALPLVRPELATKVLTAEVEYGKTKQIIEFGTDALTEERMDEIVGMISVIASDDPPAKVPSREECRRCNVGPKDCPQRVMKDQNVAQVGAF